MRRAIWRLEEVYSHLWTIRLDQLDRSTCWTDYHWTSYALARLVRACRPTGPLLGALLSRRVGCEDSRTRAGASLWEYDVSDKQAMLDIPDSIGVQNNAQGELQPSYAWQLLYTTICISELCVHTTQPPKSSSRKSHLGCYEPHAVTKRLPFPDLSQRQLIHYYT